MCVCVCLKFNIINKQQLLRNKKEKKIEKKMSRSCPFRRDISDACSWHQDQALNSNIYILSQTGPTGFLVKEENETKNYKVFF